MLLIPGFAKLVFLHDAGIREDLRALSLHPVHLTRDLQGNLPPSALVPFCFYQGDFTNMLLIYICKINLARSNLHQGAPSNQMGGLLIQSCYQLLPKLNLPWKCP